MATVLDGKGVSEKRLERLRETIDESGLHPRLATVLVGDDPASALYVRMKHQACERVHIGSINVTLPADATTARVVETVRRLNEDPEINGILVQLPLPEGIDEEAVIAAVSPGKDVDGFHPCNLGRLFSGRPRFAPCTPAGIMTLLEEYGIDPAGRRAVVIVMGLVAAFITAGTIEGFVTGSSLPTAVRVGIGVAVEVAFLTYLVVQGRAAVARGITGVLGEMKRGWDDERGWDEAVRDGDAQSRPVAFTAR